MTSSARWEGRVAVIGQGGTHHRPVRPLHHASHGPPPPRCVGGKTHAVSRRTRARGFVHERHDCHASRKKPREAERRKAHPAISAPRHLMSPPESASGAEAARSRGPLAFRRSAAALAKATERFSSAQAALRAKERTPALPAPSIALKRSTPRPGRSAGGDDARAARERSYELRPQEPHPLRQSAVTGDVPRMSGHFPSNINGDVCQ